MKRNILSLALICSSSALPLVTRAAEELPAQPAFARYEAMMNHSPFAIATVAVAPPSTPNFAKDLYIANAARLEEEGVVTLTSTTDKNMKEYLSTKGTNAHGYSISNIEWSDRVGATKVTISKDGQFATLTFNQSLLAQPVSSLAGQNPPPQPVPQQPVAASATYPNTTNQIKPAPVPMLPTPPPANTRVRGVIQRNPNPVQQPPQGAVPEVPDQ